MKILKVLSLTLICSLLPAIAQAASLTSENPPTSAVDTRLNQLTRGINISHWFAQRPTYTPNRLQTYVTDEELDNLRAAGFEHIRLPLDPIILFNENDPLNLNAEYLGYLDNALDLILQNDLAVILELHPEDTFKQRLATDNAFLNTFTQFWGALAKHLSTRNPEQLFLEVLNEPAFNWFAPENPIESWQYAQEQLLAAMRENAPEHTLIAKGNDWDNIEGLLALTPVADPNVVYNFHFYEPMVFTHQGADWINDKLELIHGLPYGVSADECKAVLADIEESARGWAYSYCNEEWNRDKIEQRIALAANWAREYNVRLTANEFGVFNAVRPQDRAAWLNDVRSVLEEYGIGWSMWDYSGAFALAPRRDGVRQIDPVVLTALGLPAQSPGSDPVITPPEEEPFEPPQSVPEPSAIAAFTLLSLAAISRKRFSRA